VDLPPVGPTPYSPASRMSKDRDCQVMRSTGCAHSPLLLYSFRLFFPLLTWGGGDDDLVRVPPFVSEEDFRHALSLSFGLFRANFPHSSTRLMSRWTRMGWFTLGSARLCLVLCARFCFRPSLESVLRSFHWVFFPQISIGDFFSVKTALSFHQVLS